MVNYKELLDSNNFPENIDYLQLDLEPGNGSTIKTLEILDNTIMDKYKFATITFEHDIYNGHHFDTKKRAYDILTKRGYIRVFENILNDGWNQNLIETPNTMYYPFEDWYVHPELVNMDYINTIKSQSQNKIKIHSVAGPCIHYKDIKY
jgi:hypothetical protein